MIRTYSGAEPAGRVQGVDVGLEPVMSLVRPDRVLFGGYGIESVYAAIGLKINELEGLMAQASGRIREILSSTGAIFRGKGVDLENAFAASNMFDVMGRHPTPTSLEDLTNAADLVQVAMTPSELERARAEVRDILLNLKERGLVEGNHDGRWWSLTEKGREVYRLIRTPTEDRIALFGEIGEYEDRIKALKGIRNMVKDYEAAEKRVSDARHMLADLFLDNIANTTQLRIAAVILKTLVPKAASGDGETTAALHEIALRGSQQKGDSDVAISESNQVLRILEEKGCVTCRKDGLWAIGDGRQAARFQHGLSKHWAASTVEDFASASATAEEIMHSIKERMANEGIALE
jgi:hypothetical protein